MTDLKVPTCNTGRWWWSAALLPTRTSAQNSQPTIWPHRAVTVALPRGEARQPTPPAALVNTGEDEGALGVSNPFPSQAEPTQPLTPI